MKDVTILMGDLNAKIEEGFEEVMGKHGVANENGEKFKDICALNKMVIVGSFFPHKRIHKATWVSPGQVTENQIDHICISKKFRRTLEDVSVKRGADASSDHYLLTAKLKLKLKRNQMETTDSIKKYNVNVLKHDETRKAFKLQLHNRFEALQELLEEDTSFDKQWGHIKEAITSSLQQAVGLHRVQHKERISVETIQMIKSRKEKKGKVMLQLQGNNSTVCTRQGSK